MGGGKTLFQIEGRCVAIEHRSLHVTGAVVGTAGDGNTSVSALKEANFK